ncbi:alpha-L-fucosidase [Sporanaerobium hydrogeniformans]|uniref:Alpha-L-fucosidase n=1 Tax=Sporanaerobium hydrogeniformans TaxID=3072179 RepID=A0AC61DEL1_9FIRM|nr:glycoside hydrolase family 95 protein [Sporanaerobium hydrogeniformans]PHV71611.1 alpha-L-fucosidase [Sporanaerobium hydrogeniformans]
MSKLWYREAAISWNEGLPMGNGKLGAMLFGGVETEHLQLNEDSIWYGGSQNRINPAAKRNLERVREFIFSERIKEAEELLRYAFSGTPQSQRPYQSLGDIKMRFKHTHMSYSAYKRELDLNTAVASVEYEMKDVQYKREYFVSTPDQVLVIHLSATKASSLSFDILLTRERFYKRVDAVGGNTLLLTGDLGKEGSEFAIGCKVETKGGSLQILGEHLIVTEADEAIIYLTATSTFYHSHFKEYVLKVLEKASHKGYELLKQDHVKDYQTLYQRVLLEFENQLEYESLPTDERLARMQQGLEDVGLVKTYFDYGRYLLISSSRKGTLPANLQGIWNAEMKPNWDSKFTININTQMNYWIAESCQLPECHEALLDLIKRLVKSGKQTAKEMYGCRGFVAHHNTDIWADTAPQDIYIPATYWVMGGAWLCTHLWMHYQYTQDKIWLEEAYPLLEEGVLFFLDFLVEKEGQLLTCPSVSPENTYILPNGTKGCICAGSTIDNEILRDLFEAYISAAKLLDKDSKNVQAAKEVLEKLPPLKIGKHGQIMEWLEDYEEEEPGHRHISQLYGLHPSHQITVDGTPLFADAAKKTLARRLKWGGGHTGWSCAWIMNFYARLWEGAHAYDLFKKLLTQSTFSNLLCNHPRPNGEVFQIDGNLGGANGILELFVQSNEKRTVLLPACPKELGSGFLKGVKVNGGVILDLAWQQGKLTSIKAYGLAHQETKLKLHYDKKELTIQLAPQEEKDVTSLLVKV